RRVLLLTAGGIVLVGLALLPLAHRQEADGRTSWVTGIPIGDRIEGIAREVFSAGTAVLASATRAPPGQWGGFAPERVCAGVAGLLCVVCLIVDVQVYGDSDLQRTDWRGLGAALGPPREARALLVQPTYATAALAVYGHPTGPLPPGSTVREVDVVGQLPAT